MKGSVKRSPVVSSLDETQFKFGVIYDTWIALATRATINKTGFLADVSAVPKRMIVGSGASVLLATCGIQVPKKLMHWTALGEDGAVVPLRQDRFLVVSPTRSDETNEIFQKTTGRSENTLVLRHEAADFALGGSATDSLVSELCPMDMTCLADDVWIATRLANCEVMLRRLKQGCVNYRLMCSPADAGFLFNVLSDVTKECGGSVVGFNDYLGLLKGEPDDTDRS